MIKIKSNNIDLIHYMTARIDIKNSGKFNNRIKIEYISDNNCESYFPDWFKHEDGFGAVVESSKGELDLKIKCIHKGKLILRLRGIYARGPNGLTIPIFIDFNSVNINGKQILDEHKVVSHDNFFECSYDVNDKDIALIHIEWTPFKPK